MQAWRQLATGGRSSGEGRRAGQAPLQFPPRAPEVSSDTERGAPGPTARPTHPRPGPGGVRAWPGRRPLHSLRAPAVSQQAPAAARAPSGRCSSPDQLGAVGLSLHLLGPRRPRVRWNTVIEAASRHGGAGVHRDGDGLRLAHAGRSLLWPCFQATRLTRTCRSRARPAASTLRAVETGQRARGLHGPPTPVSPRGTAGSQGYWNFGLPVGG